MRTFLKIAATALSWVIDSWCVIAFFLITVPLPDRIPQIKDSTIAMIAIYCAFLWLCSRANWWGYKLGWKRGVEAGWQAHVDHVKHLLSGIEGVGKYVDESAKMHSPAYNKIKSEMTDCSKPDADCDTDYKPNL